MNAAIDKQQVERQFSRAAATYDHAASLQRSLSDQLLELLLNRPDFSLKPVSILDLGCGTGQTLKELQQIFPQASLAGIDISSAMLDKAASLVPSARFIHQDMENFEVQQTYDLIISNASIQWCDLTQVLARSYKKISPGGYLAYSTFGPQTHLEISRAWQLTEPGSVHRIDFLDMQDHLSEIEKQGFELLYSQKHLYQPEFTSADKLLGSIKQTGATNAATQREKGLLSRTTYQQFIHHLESSQPVRLSYEALIFIARKPI